MDPEPPGADRARCADRAARALALHAVSRRTGRVVAARKAPCARLARAQGVECGWGVGFEAGILD
jgi:hypothetical protein